VPYVWGDILGALAVRKKARASVSFPEQAFL